MVGPSVPVAAPRVVMEALQSVEVTISDTGRSGFELTFTLSTQSPLHTIFLLAGSSPVPFLRVFLIATINGTANVIADGVVTRQQVAPGNDAAHAKLVITGEDLTALMDRQEWSGLPFPAMPAEGRVALLLAKYAALGIVPKIIPSILFDVPLPTSKIPSQKGTDYEYIQKLANDVGYVFYLEPGPQPGMNTAYWGPQIKVGVPQPALNMNMDSWSNCESLSFNFDAQSGRIPVVVIQDDTTKKKYDIPLPPITPLNPPLGAFPSIPYRTEKMEGSAKRTPTQAILIALAKAARSADSVSGQGTLDVLRYGRLLQARQLVGVRGAGMAFDGFYYVKSVTHSIKPGQYKQSFSLSRNGLVSSVPKVVA
jgi:hypothetical protein